MGGSWEPDSQSFQGLLWGEEKNQVNLGCPGQTTLGRCVFNGDRSREAGSAEWQVMCLQQEEPRHSEELAEDSRWAEGAPQKLPAASSVLEGHVLPFTSSVNVRIHTQRSLYHLLP